jgi:Fur family ferric uptake transcriptional regulator
VLGSVEVSATPKEKFREFLATKKMRLTPEREIIIEEVFSDHEHFDAEEMVNRLSRRKDSKRVSRSTVYRTLSQLEEAGLLRRVARNNDREIYEHDYGYPQHDHLICKKCGSLEEFHNEQISELIKQIAEQNTFLLEGHRLEVYGICRQCLKPPVRRHRRLDMV